MARCLWAPPALALGTVCRRDRALQASLCTNPEGYFLPRLTLWQARPCWKARRRLAKDVEKRPAEIERSPFLRSGEPELKLTPALNAVWFEEEKEEREGSTPEEATSRSKDE